MFELLEMSMGEISTQIIDEQKTKQQQRQKAVAKKNRQQKLNFQKLASSSDQSNGENTEEENWLESLQKNEFSDRNDDSEDEGESFAEGASQSIWANADDIFNPAKRDNFMSTKQSQPQKPSEFQKKETKPEKRDD